MNLHNTLIDSLRCKNTFKQFQKLDEMGELEKIIPQIKDMKLVGECKYHVLNAYDHSLKTLEEFETIIENEEFFQTHIRKEIYEYLNEDIGNELNKLQILKLGVFLHDIGKPESKTIDNTGRAHFKGHEIVGADIVCDLAKKLELNNNISNLLTKYVRYHMILLVFYKNNDMSKEKLFEVFDILDKDIIGILLLGYCDIVATRKLLNPNEDMGIIKTYMDYALTNYIYRYK